MSISFLNMHSKKEASNLCLMRYSKIAKLISSFYFPVIFDVVRNLASTRVSVISINDGDIPTAGYRLA